MKPHMTKWTRRSVQLFAASLISVSALFSWAPAAHGEANPAAAASAATVSGTASTEFRQQWEEWLRTNAYALDTIQPAPTKDGQAAEGSFADLDMLKPLLLDKRIVYLGESSHGVAEFNSVKTRLIQFLHQELGFNVVAFESPLGNAATAFGSVKTKTPEETLKTSIFPQWRSKETLPLFQYMKETQAAEQPLQLAGFDMQPMGPILAGDWMKDEDLNTRYVEAERSMWKWMSSEDLAAFAKEKSNLLNLYRDMKAKVAEHEKDLVKLYPDNPHLIAMMNRMLDDRIRLVDEYIELSIKANVTAQEGDYSGMMKMMEWRDQAMADNLLWMATEIYPTEKIIVWGHNTHISKATSRMEQSFMPEASFMGELMQNTMFGPYSYAIGLYMGSGTSADNLGETFEVQPVPANSIESLMKTANRPYTFVDLRYAEKSPGSSWMSEPRSALYFGMVPEVFVPREQYDGILYIDQVKAPAVLQ
ncbi:erythromycin esterase family protein [Paenibacillus thiaminolyticus]|uniref:Erythromycin esterase family protein n=2 Tax=Paenibacillus thiaminolyticus TaxID=49283 RepID=A0AAP9J1M8_PANTH|nr:erythromycin esterase family protein [Paenibacillus thiaminolyticus]MCY9535106.1 erythromycin esterase family protein [Paenibacillus thiaminolyticus]MCY9605259.1 erythromycin esterase family protein [Paenibacillus thiaminolyticus]MCY9609144.1 erythromycin esterase family protein [Paenibacillus thiaminolyticus]MCY9614136.1 erythromycin esterase family protein [Paenibacillus thiaminolyticus]MCY9620407.1 erythromycin esterase family protein [Paenibacillus thiaminolyticus]